MKKTLLIVLLGILPVTVTFSQESTAEIYQIADIKYDIKGSTKPFFLEQRLEYGIGDEFTSIEEVEAFVEELDQDLENLRQFESHKVTPRFDANEVVLHIELDDAWGILPIPYPKFDTEDGGRIALQVYWNNALGTLTNTKFTGGVNINADENGDLGIETWDLSYKISDIYIAGRDYDISISQELDTESKDDDEWSFYLTSLSLGTTFNLFDVINYSPSLSITANYGYDEKSGTLYDEYKDPLTISYSHGVGHSDINWYGNFRDGYSYSLSNSISLLFDKSMSASPATSISASGTYFKTFGDLPISMGTKLSGVVSFNDELLGLGSNVRGVESGNLYGDYGLFWANNLFISVIKIDGFAEAIFGPHFDYGITNQADARYGTGADFILYVDKLKSLVARGSVSIDLTEVDPSDIGLDDLEIDITSSLFF